MLQDNNRSRIRKMSSEGHNGDCCSATVSRRAQLHVLLRNCALRNRAQLLQHFPLHRQRRSSSYTGIEAEIPALGDFFQLAVEYHEVRRMKKEKINVWGRKLLVLCGEHGLMVAHGKFGNDKGRASLLAFRVQLQVLYIMR